MLKGIGDSACECARKGGKLPASPAIATRAYGMPPMGHGAPILSRNRPGGCRSRDVLANGNLSRGCRRVTLAQPFLDQFTLRRDKNTLPFHASRALAVLRHEVRILIEDPDHVGNPLELKRREHCLVVLHLIPQ
jgi:hypothetical protein